MHPASAWIRTSPKGQVVKGLVPCVALLGGSGAYMRWGLVGGLPVTEACPCRELGDPSRFISLSHLPTR
jgi:hypothetical protein